MRARQRRRDGAGQLGQGLVLFDNPSGRLDTIGIVTPRQQPADVHTSLIPSLRFARGRVIAHELWYRNTDATCCSSGKATTVWKYTGRRLVPESARAGVPHQVAGQGEGRRLPRSS
jgi:hypothetical protein